MPGANSRALEKARSLAADTLILDLEDAVAPDAKADARGALRAAVAGRPYGIREVLIRINGIDTDWGREDLDMVASADIDGVLAPKVNGAKDVVSLHNALDDRGAPAGLALWVMIETPLAILNIREIAAASTKTRLAGFVVGTNDLAKETNAVPTADRSAFIVALSLTIAAARAYGLAAIDGVYNDFRNEAGLAAECEQGRTLGFDGKSVIHPSQVETANRVFSPAAADVEHAIAIIEAFSLPENQGKGVINVDGQMVERLHLEQAERLVARDERIRQLAASLSS
jgi:citrate lyase subunit beta/citryl-CoA lyase